MTETAPAPAEFVDCGEVPVDSGRLLIVDPCHLPADLLAALTSPNDAGVVRAALIVTPTGDGWYPVTGTAGALIVDDPHAYDDPNDDRRDGGGWVAA